MGRQMDKRRKLTKGKYRTKLYVAGLVILCIAIPVYLFIWGNLFPLSPIVIGFSRHELSNINAYVQNGAAYGDLGRINDIIPGIEAFHELKFRRRPRIFFFRDRKNYLQRSITKARFCTYPNGDIVVSPWAVVEDREGIISLRIYLQHELSHSLLYQNMGPLAAWHFPQWLMEGIAVYSSGQMGTSWYPGKADTYRLIGEGNYLNPVDFKTRRENLGIIQVENPITYIYSEFACIVDYLIRNGGKERFLSYMKSLMLDNDNDRAFKAIYGRPFTDFLREFRQYSKETAGKD
jgi:hypothetical protein